LIQRLATDRPVRGLDPGEGKEFFLFQNSSKPALGPTQYPQMGSVTLLSPSSAAVRTEWSYTSTPPLGRMTCCRETFTLFVRTQMKRRYAAELKKLHYFVRKLGS
jgi:hypothetical protein